MMADIRARIERAIEEMTDNEALLEMLETDAAEEMLRWGKSLVASVVRRTKDVDDFAEDLALLPRLKAVRQTIRSVGNWAAGKYRDAESRGQLRENLLEYFRTIFGEDARLPSAGRMDAVLSEADHPQNNPHQLILKFKDLLNEFNIGDTDNVEKA
jgi:hypothetical protein